MHSPWEIDSENPPPPWQALTSKILYRISRGQQAHISAPTAAMGCLLYCIFRQISAELNADFFLQAETELFARFCGQKIDLEKTSFYFRKVQNKDKNIKQCNCAVAASLRVILDKDGFGMDPDLDLGQERRGTGGCLESCIPSPGPTSPAEISTSSRQLITRLK